MSRSVSLRSWSVTMAWPATTILARTSSPRTLGPSGRFEPFDATRGPLRREFSPWFPVPIPQPSTPLTARRWHLWARVIMAVLFAIGVADGAALALGELHRTPTAHTSQAPGSIPNAAVTGFGGYQTFGLVSEVSADWSVPKITGGPPLSDAATWIGVQDPEGAFFQIGITEEDWFGVPQCNGFWSDPDVGFHAQIILSVSPGDQISARLTQGPDGWSGTVDDETSGKTASVPASVHYGTSSTMQVPNGCKRIPVCRVKRLTNHIPRRPWSHSRTCK